MADLRLLAEAANERAAKLGYESRWWAAGEIVGTLNDGKYDCTTEDAAFIAACSPDGILRLLDRLKEHEERAKSLERETNETFVSSGGEATWQRPPKSWWREVPCGHPQDPVAWPDPEGGWMCHCGWSLEPAESDVNPTPDSGMAAIVPCGKCGCYVGIPKSEGAGEKAGTETGLVGLHQPHPVQEQPGTGLPLSASDRVRRYGHLLGKDPAEIERRAKDALTTSELGSLPDPDSAGSRLLTERDAERGGAS